MTAYEMRISDWSSDVCSSDLGPAGLTAANEDYNPLVIANLDDADRLVAMVVHKPPHIPARLKPALYRDALKYRDQLDGLFWVIASEMRDHPLHDRLGEVRAPTPEKGRTACRE